VRRAISMKNSTCMASQGRIDPSIPMVHFICEAQFLHVSSSTAKELDAMGERIGWLVMPASRQPSLPVVARLDSEPRRS